MKARKVRLLGPLLAGVTLLVSSGLPVPAAPEDLDDLRAEAQAVADEVTALEHNLVDLQREHKRVTREIDATNVNLALLEQELGAAQDAYEHALDAHIRRAVEAYKGSSASSLTMFLSAQNFTQMMTIAEARGQIAKADAAALDELERATTELEEARGELEDRKSALLAKEARVEELQLQMDTSVTERRVVLEELMNRIALLEEAARREAARLERLRREAEEAEAEEVEEAARSAPPPKLPPTDKDFADLLGPSGPTNGIPEGFVGTGVSFEGIASWYGPGFEGNPTASGDIFDPDLYTAASLDLPLGTWLYVEHKGRGVLVYVNDRGPYIEGRILDLSQAAAEAIGISGLGWISAEVVLEK